MERVSHGWGKFIFVLIACAVIYTIINNFIWSSHTAQLINPVFEGHAQAKRWMYLLSVGMIHLILAPLYVGFYKRSYLDLIGSSQNWKNQVMVAQIFVLFVFISTEPLYLWAHWNNIQFSWASGWGQWLFWILPYVVAIFLQTSAEEFYFRGFMQSQLLKLTNSPKISIILPAIIWGAAHNSIYSDTALKIAVVLQMSTLGIVLGLWRMRSGSLWGPIGVHFFINIFTVVFFGNSLRPSAELALVANFSQISLSGQAAYLLISIPAFILVYGFCIQKRIVKI